MNRYFDQVIHLHKNRIFGLIIEGISLFKSSFHKNLFSISVSILANFQKFERNFIIKWAKSFFNTDFFKQIAFLIKRYHQILFLLT